MSNELGRWTVVTGSDAAYFPLLKGLILSISDRAEEAGREKPDIHVMDVGLNGEQKEWLAGRVMGVFEPGWDVPEEHVEFVRGALGGGIRAQASRPYLKRYLPGYDVYLWMDADVWCQRWDVLEWYVLGAAKYGMTMTPQLHRGFRCSYPRGAGPTMLMNAYLPLLGAERSEELAWRLPQINAGVLAMRAEGPHWEMWGKMIAEVVRASREAGGISSIFDQIALMLAIYYQGLPVHPLPAICNWPVGESMPLLDINGKVFREAQIPHEVIGILHLIMNGVGAAAKLGVVGLQTLEGGTAQGSIDYLTVRKDLLGKEVV